MTMLEVLSVLTGVTGLCGSSFGLIVWWRGSIKKEFAAEAQFNQIQRNQAMMQTQLLALREQIVRLHERTEIVFLQCFRVKEDE